MSSIYDWSTTAASNNNSDANITWDDNQAPSTVDNSGRAMMARVAELLKDIGCSITAGGSANAITVTAGSDFTTYSNRLVGGFTASNDNTGATTINFNSIGAKSLRLPGDIALSGGEIKTGLPYLCLYSTAANSAAGAWILINPSHIATFNGNVTINGTLTVGT